MNLDIKNKKISKNSFQVFSLRIIFILLAFFPVYGMACLPNEVHVREQWINPYSRQDGTHVSEHIRSEHCREIDGDNYFQNINKKEIKGLKTKFKAWTETEKTIVDKELNNLPVWLKKYKLADIFRASLQEGNPLNPAMTIPATKTLIFFDKFFTATKKREIIIHELSHIAVWDIDPIRLQDFFVSRGWEYEKGKPPKPPREVILPDSKESASEDFANSVELYYSDPLRLKAFNPQSFLILDSIIKSKEKQ